MKVGIYLIDAVVTGTTKYVFQLADGLIGTGHDVKTITSTKAGREPLRWNKSDGGARWWFQSPDLTVRHDDLADTFDKFDLIILQDVGSSTLDNEDFRFGLPGYVCGLLQTTTPWGAVAHGNSYDKKHAPHFPKLLSDSKRPPKALLATSAPYDYSKHELFSELTAVHMKRPYRSKYDVHAEQSQGSAVSTMGRFSTGKSLHALALTLPFAGDSTPRITIDGACISSARPTDSYLTYEVLEKLDSVTPIWTPESKNRTSPWSMKNAQGTMLEYRGSYTDPSFLHVDSKVFVNLTMPWFSAGTEYTSMEAIDAGCLLLTTPHMVDINTELVYGKLQPWDVPRSPKNTFERNEQDLRDLASRIDLVMKTDRVRHLDVAQWNRHVLEKEHAPAAVATKLMNDLNETEI